MAFIYAEGAYDTLRAKAASAFSKGDLLVLDSNSSVSRVEPLTIVADRVAGIALADSTQSIIDDEVGFLVPGDDCTLRASLDTTLTSHILPGDRVDVVYGVGNGGYYVTSSSNSTAVAVLRGTAGALAMDQSVQSQVLVRLLDVEQL